MSVPGPSGGADATTVGDAPGANATPTPASNDPKAGTPVPSTRPVVAVSVVEVVDGDTVKVVYENGTRDTVRLLGVDTPEVYGENTPGEFEGVPETEAGRACLDDWAARASAFTKAELTDETVRLGFDEREGRRGYYDRLLAYIYVDGRQFNYRLVAEGYARRYDDSQFVERERYGRAEQRAMDGGRGLWACRSPESSGTADGDGNGDGADDAGGSDANAPLEIRVHADAEGADGENLNDEYVVLTNTGETALELDGWTVTDAAGHRYAVPDDTRLATGASLTIHTGSGDDAGGDRYWGASSPVWNNDGDTVTVRDADGTVVAERTYE